LGFKLKPTINKRNATPICEKTTSISWDFIRFKKNGLTMIPVRMYPMIVGCLRIFMIAANTAASTKIMLISMKIFEATISPSNKTY